MSNGRGEELKAALAEYDALGPAERDDWLARLERRDPSLAREVAAWLATPTHRPEPGRGLSAVVDAAAAGATYEAGEEAEILREIGPYRLVEVLGAGGMGVVYRAEQETPVRREVALKLLRGVLGTERVVSRFESERRALSLADHPGIARILDAGVDADGTPYLAMELVRGMPITRFARERAIDRRTMLDLFVQVCRAVQHAHQKGIIHRDLKPSNILVTEVDSRPQVKVIDFGIARVLDETTPAGTLLTHEGQVVGTLEYMSPEQALGSRSEIDTRSDVYSLGVLLYELLTGELPHDLQGKTLAEAVRIVDQETPRRFRDATRATRGGDELETVCLKALAREPARRYDGPAAFADDIERFQRDQPILARPPSTAYQLRKLVTRHRAPVAVGAGALALLLGFGVAMSALYSAERREAAKREAVIAFLQGMLAAPDPYALGRDVSVRRVLDHSLSSLGGSLAGQPEVLAAAQTTLGVTYRQLGEYGRADSLLRSALALRARRVDLEAALTLQALAQNSFEAGHRDEADSLGRRALEAIARTKGPGSREYASCLRLLGDIQIKLGRLTEADSMLHRCESLTRRLYGESDPELSRVLMKLGHVANSRGDGAGAERLFGQAVAIQQRSLGLNHPETLWSVDSYVELFQGPSVVLDSMVLDLVARSRVAFGPDHPYLAAILRHLTALHIRQHRLQDAESDQMEMIGIYRRAFGDSSVYLPMAYGMMADVKRAQHDLEDAESWSRRSVALSRRIYKPEQPRVGIQMRQLAGLLVELGRDREAHDLYHELIEIRRRAYGLDNVLTAEDFCSYGTLMVDVGEIDSAEVLLRQALPVLKTHPTPRAMVPLCESSLAICDALRGRTAEADELITAFRDSLPTWNGDATLRRGSIRRVLHHFGKRLDSNDLAYYQSALVHVRK